MPDADSPVFDSRFIFNDALLSSGLRQYKEYIKPG